MDKLIWYDSDGRINCRRGYEVALARLASYEATGMMPDEIVKMGMAYEDSKRYSGRLELKLMPYLNIGLSPDELKALMLASAGTCVAEIKAFDGVGIDRLCELAEADKDGRVVVRPCKGLSTKPDDGRQLVLEQAIAHLESLLRDHDFECEDCKRDHRELLELLVELKERRG